LAWDNHEIRQISGYELPGRPDSAEKVRTGQTVHVGKESLKAHDVGAVVKHIIEAASGRHILRIVNQHATFHLFLVVKDERPRSHASQVPWDLKLAVGRRDLTPAAAKVVTLAGTLEPFGQAAERTLTKMAGLRLSESTVERTTEEAGVRLGQLLREKISFGAKRPWAWQRDAAGCTCVYVSLDATGVRRQGPAGAQAEGRMAYVGMVYNARSEHDSRRLPPHQVRYLAGFYGLDALGLELSRQAAEVGWDEAQQQIALCDGGLEEFFRKNFPRAQCILDFYHASEHVANLARALHPTAEKAFAEQTHAWCHQLKHEGGAALLSTLEQLPLDDYSAAVREVRRQETQYLRNNVQRNDYPAYLARGWQIGTGPIEAACKTVVGQRLKGSGMRWGDDGADALCHLRALYLSEPDQWETFWLAHPN
jgi:hypothetical protein